MNKSNFYCNIDDYHIIARPNPTSSSITSFYSALTILFLFAFCMQFANIFVDIISWIKVISTAMFDYQIIARPNPTSLSITPFYSAFNKIINVCLCKTMIFLYAFCMQF